jgi:hypothetical protein
MKSKEASCHTVGTAVILLTFRKKPFRELSGHLYQVANEGFQLGDILYATYCVLLSFFMLIHLKIILCQVWKVQCKHLMAEWLSLDRMVNFYGCNLSCNMS